MAQNFRRYVSNNVGTSAETIYTLDSNDTIVGISVANVASATINVSVYITSGGNDIHLIKDTPIVQGSALQIIDGKCSFCFTKHRRIKSSIRYALVQQMYGLALLMIYQHNRK